MTYFIFNRLVQYRKVTGSIDSNLLIHANTLNSLTDVDTGKALERKRDCSRTLRKLAGDLGATYNAIPLKRLFVLAKIIPSEKKLEEAVKKLGGLSNSAYNDLKNKNQENMEAVRKLLNIPRRWKN